MGNLFFDPENPEFLDWESGEDGPPEKIVCRWCKEPPVGNACSGRFGRPGEEFPHEPVITKIVACQCGDTNVFRISDVSGWESHRVGDEAIWDPGTGRYAVVEIGEFVEGETTDTTDVHYECSHGHVVQTLIGADEEWT